jgi:hypothetical protein
LLKRSVKDKKARDASESECVTRFFFLDYRLPAFSGQLLVILYLIPFAWDDNPENQIGQDAGQTAGYQQQHEEQAKPERADPEKGAQAAANAGNDAVLAAQLVAGFIRRHVDISPYQADLGGKKPDRGLLAYLPNQYDIQRQKLQSGHSDPITEEDGAGKSTSLIELTIGNIAGKPATSPKANRARTSLADRSVGKAHLAQTAGN